MRRWACRSGWRCAALPSALRISHLKPRGDAGGLLDQLPPNTLDLALEALRQSNRDQQIANLRAAQDWCRDHSDATDVAVHVGTETCAARLFNLAPPSRVRWRAVPSNKLEARLDLVLVVLAERGDAAAGGADERRETTPDIDMDVKGLVATRDGHHNDVVKPMRLEPDGGHPIRLRQFFEDVLNDGRKPAASQQLATQGEQARAQPPRLGFLVEADELLGRKRPQDVQAG